MSLRHLWVLPLSAWLLVGCTPKIGNKCTLSTDCSQLGDRLCDTTQPEGYCTIFNCEPDNCPDSICVSFDSNLDPACKSADDGRWPRFERTFCMRPCSVPGIPGDCRDGYMCVDLTPTADNGNLATYKAQVVDTGAADGGLGYAVCMANPCYDGLDPTKGCDAADAGAGTSGTPGVCSPATDAGGGWTPYKPDGGTGGAGGATSTGGAGGATSTGGTGGGL